MWPEAQLLEHARQLGRSHSSFTTRGTARPLRRSFVKTRKRIHKAYAALAEGAEHKRDPSPAELWLLDNGHVVEGQLREIDEDLPWGYLIQLPRISRGRMRGYPLVYALCLDYLRHTDCHLDLAALSRFVEAYQAERTLSIGELWAIPIMLRLGLVLAVSALASSEAAARDRDVAAAWAERLLGASLSSPAEADGRDPHGPLAVLAELERWRARAPLSAEFLVTLLGKLRTHDDASPEALAWIARQTESLGISPEELARGYHLRQAADQVSVGNAVTSMRSVNTVDWSNFFRAASRVEGILRRDPADTYARMDEASTDRCRHAVEKLARRSRTAETVVAEAALTLASRHRGTAEEYRAHVGYYLLDDGQDELHRSLGYVPRLDYRLAEFIRRQPTPFYIGSVAALTLSLAMTAWATLSGVDSPLWVRALLLPAMLFAASEIAIAVVNAAVVTLVPPRILPKLEFRNGVPPNCSTLVVVPTLLDATGLDRLLEELEVRSLANADDNLYFALLTDFPDAEAAELPEDAELLERARLGIEGLNAGKDGARFFLFHRGRQFNSQAQRFMGWERKRGKLHELNRLLRGATDTTFQLVTAPPELLSGLRFVITLDTDTELPLGVARRLVATLAHPLNRPWLDPRRQRVVRGHGLIQPRVGTSPLSARRSIFARLAAGPPGIDPYTTAVSDVYQDLLGEGSFVGKGIYDIDAFEAAMAGRVPDNQVLSHDLLESIYVRSALASDIEVIDEQPAAYSVATGRHHRWMRGDWQLLPWLWPQMPGKPKRRRYDFRAFDAWRVLDNLRRSLLAPALCLLAAVTWLSGFEIALAGTLLLLSVFVAPVIGRLVFSFARSGAQLEWLGGLGGDLKSNAKQAALSLIFLLDQALVSLDAITVALYRQFIDRRRMLEWTSMRDAASRDQGSVLRVPRLLVAGLLSLLLGLAILYFSPSTMPIALPVLVMWASSPWVAVWISRIDPEVVAEPWGEVEALAFRRISRKTWRFFERFVGDLDHHLPPDNFQEEPRGVVAHRTSPTNIGLYLLSVAAARDLGFIQLHEATERWQRTLLTIEGLEKRDGHILNWYDTTTLSPLEPRYVSTVDSGNFAAFLWTFAEACREAGRVHILSEWVLQATLDAVYLATEALQQTKPNAVAVEQARELVLLLEKAEVERRARPSRLPFLVFETNRALAALLERRPATSGVPEFEYWLETARHTLRDAAVAIDSNLPHFSWLEQLTTASGGPPLTGEAGVRWQAFESALHAAASYQGLLQDVEAVVALAKVALADLADDVALAAFERLLQTSRGRAAAQIAHLDALAARADKLVLDMDFSALYDEERSLFSIGYNLSGARLDNSHYDLLASEARLASLVAIAKGDVPAKHWFKLGRLRARYASKPGLLSWSGSMFEYLMPLLVTRSYPDTLLDQTCHAVVERQIAHAGTFRVPWGISESAYNVMDLSLNYQYRAFGVPELGLKPGLGEDLVIAPYATALAALVRARAAARNFEELRRAGIDGPFGFYESADYTPSRLPPTRNKVVVKAFMAHHQGMTLVALANLLTDFAMQRRFHADLRIKACALLLEERIPARAGVVEPEAPRAVSTLAAARDQEVNEHLDLVDVQAGPRRGHLLGQGDLSTWVTGAGEGFLTWRGIDAQRFREDASLECGGIYLYFQNLDRDTYWSSGFMPSRAQPSHYDAVFSVDKVEFGRRDGDVETLTEITLSPEQAAEVRRITLTNHAASPVQLAVTSFTELSLSPRSADMAHPAFQKMFIETEYLPDQGVLIAHRRKRASGDPSVWMAQLFQGTDGVLVARAGTSRSAFLGRGGSLQAPAGLTQTDWAEGASGTLDPAFVLRRQVLLLPGTPLQLSLVTLLAESRPALLERIAQFSDGHSIARAFEFAWADARVELRHLGIDSPKAQRYQRLLSAVLFPQAPLAGGANPPAGTRGRDALWSQGISGDLPLVVLRLDEPEVSELCRDALLAHEYWRLNGVTTDLVILNEEAPSYFQPVQDAVFSMIRSTPAEGHVDQRGGVFVRRTALIPAEDLQLILGAARVVLSVSKGSLSGQLRSLATRRPRPLTDGTLKQATKGPPPPPGQRLPDPAAAARPASSTPVPGRALAFHNGLGGFDLASGDYVMRIGPAQTPPQPWSNVMANPQFGALVTESGSSFTWFENRQKYRLTPWSNDPTLDPSGELFYLRDLDEGESWSLTPAPAGGAATYDVRHGQGHSSFEHTRTDLVQRLSVAVDPSDPVKIWHVTLENRSDRPRRLRLYGYVEWTLGSHRDTLRASTITNYRPDLRAIFARNPMSPFPRSRVFLASTAEVRSSTSDRDEFFGRFGTRAAPQALTASKLSDRSGPDFDPCGALELELELEPGARASVAFVLGTGQDEREALELVGRYSDHSEAEAVLGRARDHWQELLGHVQVRTPDPAFDLMTNHWLPYQALSCRFWGRSAFFQSGGAYGFRDQLQDSMALLHLRPELTRQHLLLAASRQFLEGDVQHFWHADTGEGIRTRCSDDLLWLPWAALEYAAATENQAIWDESVAFLQERLLEPDEEDLYGVPPAAAESASLYEHCVRALWTGATRGSSGLPLMQSGDWNDGMNRVGAAGRGESVWLAWFLAHVLERFSEVAERRGDTQRAEWCRAEASRIGDAVDKHAWDGFWYHRATFDDGSALGSSGSPECRIDAIAQSWAVISGAGRPDRAKRALDASLRHLWHRREKIMLLLAPPFSGQAPDPGYVAAYPPGIRENGGQYTHGVLWTVLALLLERRGAEAYELLSELNPIHHSSDPAGMAKYAAEPYVLAADVYSVAPHVGRGGWTWYTGSAAWMYRVGLEWVLGLKRQGDALFIDPCVPPSWQRFEVDYRTESGGVLSIVFENPEGVSHGVAGLWLDKRTLPSSRVPLPAAGERKQLRVRLGAQASDPARQPATLYPGADRQRQGALEPNR